MNVKETSKILRGVNLGGWLVLEKWITPSLFKGTTALDETSLLNEKYIISEKLLNDHSNSFITKDDFKYLSEKGINSVRVPIGHWIFAKDFRNCEKYLELVFKYSSMFNISVILDLHAAPGGQNKEQHSALTGVQLWDKDKTFQEQSFLVIKNIVDKYKIYNPFGIELLNEPSASLSKKMLSDYYLKCNEYINSNSNIKTIINDGFNPYYWVKEIQKLKLKNVLLDMHLYQCFSERDKNLNINKHLDKTINDWGKLIEYSSKSIPVIVGEWSLALDFKSLKGLDKHEIEAAYLLYGKTQLQVFEKALGSYYWTYKTESNDNWNFKYLIENNLFPK